VQLGSLNAGTDRDETVDCSAVKSRSSATFQDSVVKLVDFVWAALLLVVLAVCWVLTLLGMPGNWLMIGVAIGFVFLVSAESPVAIGWVTVVVLLVLALIGELLEFLAGALGVTKAGGSRRGAVLALVGSLVGGIAGLFVGLPIPIVGSLLGAVLLAGLGAFGGAVLGEQWKGRDLGESMKIGEAAFWGRLLGTVAKTAVGAVMIGAVVVALVA